MSLKEAILKSLDECKKADYNEVFNKIKEKRYYEFNDDAKTPDNTVSAYLTNFIKNKDVRVKRVKKGRKYQYYLTKNEDKIEFEEEEDKTKDITYSEASLHKLFSTYLKQNDIYSKTIDHKKSAKTGKDGTWIHPDMIGMKLLALENDVSVKFLKTVNRADSFKLSSYELKTEINTDKQLKEYFFQAVSNSSWANYGYLVAIEFNDNLREEMERLSQSFGIGIIKLKSNPFESEVLYPSRYRELDFITLDKLCSKNEDFRTFIENTERLISASKDNFSSTEKGFVGFCDVYFGEDEDSEISEYCKNNNIPVEETTEKE